MYAIILLHREPEIYGHENVYLTTQETILLDTLCETKKELIRMYGKMLGVPEQIKHFYEYRIARIKISKTPVDFFSTKHKMLFDGEYQTVFLSCLTQHQHLDVGWELSTTYMTKRQTKLVKELQLEKITDKMTLAKLYNKIYHMEKDKIDIHRKNKSTINEIQMSDIELEEYFKSGKGYFSMLSPDERKALFEPSDLLP